MHLDWLDVTERPATTGHEALRLDSDTTTIADRELVAERAHSLDVVSAGEHVKLVEIFPPTSGAQPSTSSSSSRPAAAPSRITRAPAYCGYPGARITHRVSPGRKLHGWERCRELSRGVWFRIVAGCCRSPSSVSVRRPTSSPASPSRSTTTTRAAGEADGVWLGAGAERLGLDGAVDADDLRAVLAGMAPGTGRVDAGRVDGRTHRAAGAGVRSDVQGPEVGVSVLYAVSDDPRVQGAIIDAGETAVRAALAWLEREAIWVRRGSGDVAYLNDLAARDPDAAERARQRPVPGQGVVAAAFRHRTVTRPVTRCCTGTPWSPTSSKDPTAGGGRSCTPSCTATPAPPGRCSRRCCAASSPPASVSSGGRGVTSPRSPASRRRCASCSRNGRWRSTPGSQATGTANDAGRPSGGGAGDPAHKPELEGERFDAAWKTEAVDAGWGPDHAEALIASTTPRRAPDVGEVWRIPDRRPGDGCGVRPGRRPRGVGHGARPGVDRVRRHVHPTRPRRGGRRAHR